MLHSGERAASMTRWSSLPLEKPEDLAILSTLGPRCDSGVLTSGAAQAFIDLVTVVTILSTDGMARSSKASAAGRGMCGVVMRTTGPSSS